MCDTGCGLVQNFSADEIALYEPHCYPSTVHEWWASSTGFLAQGEKLIDVVATDNGKIQELLKVPATKHVHKILGLALKWIITGHADGYEKYYHADRSKYVIHTVYWRGCQPCPFASMLFSCCNGAEDHTVTKPDGTVLKFGSLLSQMICRHGFYEGSVPHRVDPAQIIDFAGIKI